MKLRRGSSTPPFFCNKFWCSCVGSTEDVTRHLLACTIDEGTQKCHWIRSLEPSGLDVDPCLFQIQITTVSLSMCVCCACPRLAPGKVESCRARRHMAARSVSSPSSIRPELFRIKAPAAGQTGSFCSVGWESMCIFLFLIARVQVNSQ